MVYFVNFFLYNFWNLNFFKIHLEKLSIYLFKKHLIFKYKLLKSRLNLLVLTIYLGPVEQMLPVSTNISKTDWRHAICNSFLARFIYILPGNVWTDFKSLSSLSLKNIQTHTHFCKVSVMSYTLWRVPFNQYVVQHEKIWLYNTWKDEVKVLCTNSNIRQVYPNKKYLAWQVYKIKFLEKINSTYILTHFKEAMLYSRIITLWTILIFHVLSNYVLESS